jgi:hypothetical protein
MFLRVIDMEFLAISGNSEHFQGVFSNKNKTIAPVQFFCFVILNRLQYLRTLEQTLLGEK